MEHLKELRIAAGKLQKDVASALGIDRTTYVKYEKGSNEPNFDMVSAIADYFGVTVDYLLGREDPRTPSPTITDDVVKFQIIGEVAAGYDHFAIEDWSGEEIAVPREWLHGRAPSDFFALRVVGESMYPLYLDGDIVLVKRQPTVSHSGDVGVVLYEGDCATLKKVELREESLSLVPVNPSFPPVVLRGEDVSKCKILGIPQLLLRDVCPGK